MQQREKKRSHLSVVLFFLIIYNFEQSCCFQSVDKAVIFTLYFLFLVKLTF